MGIAALIVLSSLLGGVAIAGMITWLSTTKGNTMKEILASQKFGDADAIRLEVSNIFKLSSTVPIVGLYIVALLVVVTLPAYYFWQLRRDVNVIYLVGTVDFGGINVNEAADAYLVAKEMEIEETGAFAIPLAYESGMKLVKIKGRRIAPKSLRLEVDTDANSILVRVIPSGHGATTVPIKIGTRSAVFEKMIKLAAKMEEAPASPYEGDVEMVGSGDSSLSPFAADAEMRAPD